MNKLYEYKRSAQKTSFNFASDEIREKSADDAKKADIAYNKWLTDASALYLYFRDKYGITEPEEVIKILQDMQSNKKDSDVLNELIAIKNDIKTIKSNAEAQSHLLRSLTSNIKETHRVTTRVIINTLKEIFTVVHMMKFTTSAAIEAIYKKDGLTKQDAQAASNRSEAAARTNATSLFIKTTKTFLTDAEMKDLGIVKDE